MRVRLSVLVVSMALMAAAVLGCSSEESPPQQQAQPQTQTVVQADQPEQQTQQTQQAQQTQPASPSEPEPQAQQEQPEAAPTQNEAPQQDQSQQDQPEQELPAPESEFTIGGERPATLRLPADADRSQPRPLIVLLHGYSSNSREVDGYFQSANWVEAGGAGVLIPDGVVDLIGNQSWNATPECCDWTDEVDDVAYITLLIEEARTLASFDQVFAVGHSNGGFMSYRLACEAVPGLTGIVSLAGGPFADPELCRVPEPLSVLQIHGSNDRIVLYDGGRLPDVPDPDRGSVPGAVDTVLRWADRAGCDLQAGDALLPIDLDANLAGDETSVKRMINGCADGVKVELWTIEGGSHVPWVFGTDFSLAILHWIESVYEGDLEARGFSEPTIAKIGIGGNRPTSLLMPNDVEGPLPLIVSLHGYGGDASAHDWYFGLSQRVEAYGFALITPQGTSDGRGRAFWNATDYCCNFDGSDIDDAGYIASLIDEAREHVDVDRVYVVGYSNGGFMAYRLACDGIDGLAGIVSLAGSSFGDDTRCADAPPVSVLQIHGTADLDIPYDGTMEQGYSAEYPGAVALAERWAQRAGCNLDALEVLEPIDLDEIVEGAETRVQRYADGCADGVIVEQWTLDGVDHSPFFSDDWPDHLLGWLLGTRAG